jgi:hypothetical protein
MTREETQINQIVGIKDGELYVLEYVFKHSDGFKGATGYHMGTISQSYIDEMNDPQYLEEEFDYIWREAVQAERTTDSLQDFMQNWIDECSYYGQLYPSDDNSYRYETEKLIEELPADQKEKLEKVFGVMGEDFATWSCSGGGRCFNANDEWDIIFRPDLIELIIEYEN